MISAANATSFKSRTTPVSFRQVHIQPTVLTILRRYSTKHNISLLVNLHISEAILLPGAQSVGNLLASSSLVDRKANVCCCWFDIEQLGKPISVGFDLSCLTI